MGSPDFFDVIHKAAKIDISEIQIRGQMAEAAFICAFADQRDANTAFTPMREAEDLEQNVLGFLDCVEAADASERQFSGCGRGPFGMGFVADVEGIADDASVAQRGCELTAGEIQSRFGDKISGEGGFVSE